MASIAPHKCLCFFAALLCLGICCKSDEAPAEAVEKAMICFSSQYIYSSCQESYRLTAQGSINVPTQAADQYCGGPCFAETNLVLDCVNGILHDFRFYNGASLEDLRYTLDRGCGHSPFRGDFNVLDHLGGYPGGTCGEGYGGQQPGGFQNPTNGGAGFQNPSSSGTAGFQNPSSSGTAGFQNPTNGFGLQNPDDGFGVYCDEASKLPVVVPFCLLTLLASILFLRVNF